MFFNRVKNWPEDKRKRFALIFSLIITILIIILGFGINLVIDKNQDNKKIFDYEKIKTFILDFKNNLGI